MNVVIVINAYHLINASNVKVDIHYQMIKKVATNVIVKFQHITTQQHFNVNHAKM